MGLRMKSIQNLILLISILTAALASTGCKSEGSGILGKQSVTSTTEDPLIVNTPFAYDYAADTISYNSCVITTPSIQDPVLHGLKMGSNEGFVDNLGTGAVKAGVKLRSDFLQYVGKNFSPDYPSNTITSPQITRILNDKTSVLNKNAYLQFAVRKKSDYTVIPDLISPVANAQIVPGRDAIVFTQNLSSGYLGYSITKNIVFDTSGGVLAEGSRVYDLADTQDSVPIEGLFNFNATIDETYAGPNPIPYLSEPFGAAEVYSQKVRDSFNAGTQLLSATFGGTGSTSGNPVDDAIGDTVNNIKRPYKVGTTVIDTAKAFGRGYQLKFQSQDLSSTSTWPKSRLTNVTEIALDTGAPAAGTSWTCEQFPIAPPNYWNNTRTSNKAWVKESTMVEPNCAPLLATDTNCVGGDSAATCAIKKDRVEKVKRIRRQYSVDAWNIGLMFTAKSKTGYSVPNGNSRITDPNNGLTIELCVSPKSSNSCYLPTVGILNSGLTVPADKTLDVGIQFDRTQECYLTMATIAGDRDPKRRNGRCAQFASICTRTSSSY